MSTRPARMNSLQCYVVTAVVMLCLSNALADDLPLARPATDSEIKQTIADLAHESPQVRDDSVRRLIAIGPQAEAALREAVESGAFEIARRAQHTLETIENVYFTNVDIHIEPSKHIIKWDEPLDLIITLTNNSNYPARVPFDLAAARSSANAATQAVQVGNMLDLADWLTVLYRGKTESRSAQQRVYEIIPLHVEDVALDPEVEKAVDTRTVTGPVSVIAPGDQIRFTVRSINRGWARYRLLDQGAYEAVVRYVPPWDDEALKRQEVWSASSNVARISVFASAPEAISRTGSRARAHLEKQDGKVAAIITNTYDSPIIVNLNFGPMVPFAQSQWVVSDNRRRIVKMIEGENTGWASFTARRFVRLAPGESCELCTIDDNELQRILETEFPQSSSGAVELNLRYKSFADRRWQRMQKPALSERSGVPRVLQTPLPLEMLSIELVSDFLSLSPTTEHPALSQEEPPATKRSPTR